MKICCPICGKELFLGNDQQPNPHRPFCSQRCRWIDLANWMDGMYSLEAQEEKETGSQSPVERPETD